MNGPPPPAQDQGSFFHAPLAYRPSRKFNPAFIAGTAQLPSNPLSNFVSQGTNNSTFNQTHYSESEYDFQVPPNIPVQQLAHGYNNRSDESTFYQASQDRTTAPQHYSTAPQAYRIDHQAYMAGSQAYMAGRQTCPADLQGQPQQLESYAAHPSYSTRPSLAQLLHSLSPPTNIEAANPIPSPEIPSITVPEDPEPPLDVYEAINKKQLQPTEQWRDENVATPFALARYLEARKTLHYDYGSKYMNAFVSTADEDEDEGEEESKREDVRFLVADNRKKRKQKLRKRWVKVGEAKQMPLPVMPERVLGEFTVMDFIEDDGGQFEEGDV